MRFTESIELLIPDGCSALKSDRRGQSALLEAAAICLQVSYSDLTYSDCSGITSNIERMAVLKDSSLSKVSVQLSVVIPPMAIYNTSSSIQNYFNQLQLNINSAVRLGNFSSALHTSSILFNSTLTSAAVILSATASLMSIEGLSTLSPTSAPAANNSGSGKSSGINVGLIVGVIIGVTAFLALFSYFLLRRVQKTSTCYSQKFENEFETDFDAVSVHLVRET